MFPYRAYPFLASLVVVLVLLLIAGPRRAIAQQRWTLEIDNDAFNVTTVGGWRAHPVGRPSDEDYTNGLRLKLPRTGPSPLGRLVRLPATCTPGAALDHSLACHSWRVVVAHAMYTPNLDAARDAGGQRAFAGWLGGAVETDLHAAHTRHTLSAGLGLVGPAALAGPAQRALHALIGSRAPHGWHAQLATEPTVDIAYRGSAMLAHGQLTPRLMASLEPIWEVNVGTTRRSLGAGGTATASIGGADLAHWRARPSTRSGAFFVASVQRRFVAGDLFLDGGLLHAGTRVGHETLVTATDAGFGVLIRGRGLEWRYIRTSREYPTQLRPHAYVTLALIH